MQVLHIGGQKVWVLYRNLFASPIDPSHLCEWQPKVDRVSGRKSEWERTGWAHAHLVQNWEHAANSFTLLFNTGVSGFCSQDNMILWRLFHLSSVLEEMLIRYSLSFHLFWGFVGKFFSVNMAVGDRYCTILLHFRIFKILNVIFRVFES